MGHDAMITFWRGFLTGMQDGPRLFFAPLVAAAKGVRRLFCAVRGR